MIKCVFYKNDSVANEFELDPSDHYGIYDRLMKITDGDHEVSSNVASWAELASVGERYDLREGYMEIEEVM